MKYKKLLENCNLCRRKCNCNRLEDHLGFCKSNAKIKIARAALHFWEEPPISGTKGSGTIFFSNCNLSCVFCQNHRISHEGYGEEISIEKLSTIFLELQDKGANNINLVTPTHYVPQIIEAIELSRKSGLNLPILYNTNGYDSLETIKLLKGYVDVYLPDFKYFNNSFGEKYSRVGDYHDNLISILKEMESQVGQCSFSKEGLIEKGVIIRHLMLPGLLFDSKNIVDEIYNTFNDSVYISIMNQYIPMYQVSQFPEINKALNPKHYDSLINYAAQLGVVNGFIQEEGTNKKDYIPDFNLQGI